MKYDFSICQSRGSLWGNPCYPWKKSEFHNSSKSELNWTRPNGILGELVFFTVIQDSLVYLHSRDYTFCFLVVSRNSECLLLSHVLVDHDSHYGKNGECWHILPIMVSGHSWCSSPRIILRGTGCWNSPGVLLAEFKSRLEMISFFKIQRKHEWIENWTL